MLRVMDPLMQRLKLGLLVVMLVALAVFAVQQPPVHWPTAVQPKVVMVKVQLVNPPALAANLLDATPMAQQRM